ncbi:MAG: SpoIIE family protein phosphatase [Bdellovibrionales bacterium]|nr:SpoIIE family protein phosphatase [Bdellovibrionales bacterium]
MKRISIRIKFIMILVSITTAMLSVYSFFALNDFQSDKIAYVFESTLSESKSTARQIEAELKFVLEKTENYLSGYNLVTNRFSSNARRAFSREKSVAAIWSYHYDKSTGTYQKFDKMGDDGSGIIDDKGWDPYFQEIVADAILNEITIRTFEGNKEQWLMALRFQPNLDQQPSVVLALVTESSFRDSFANSTLSDALLVNGNSDIIIKPIKANYIESLPDVQAAVDKTTQAIKAPVGTNKYVDSNGGSWLISLANVNLGNMRVISLIPKSVALEAIRLLIIKSAILFAVVFFLTIALSVWVSSQFTSRINTLFEATKKIAKGDFNVQVAVQSEDEISGLAKGFNSMAVEIRRLLDETAEKARMEAELNTAKLVQSTLFPEDQFENDEIKIRGFYEPASECGGDWWYFSQVGHKTFLWIGDATGHGVPAALVTAAAKSAASVLESFPDIPVHDIMKMMNQAIYGTSKGQVLMTFFLGCLDNETGVLTYSSASHDPPYLLRNSKRGSIKKRDVVPLMDDSGPRLGESPESQYHSIEVQIEAQDRIIFYTDGVPELKNSEDKMMGERNFIRTLIASFNENHDLDISMSDLSNSIDRHRESAALEDDVTYFMMEYKKAG